MPAPPPAAPANPYAQNPYARNPYARNPYAQNPYGQNPYASGPAGPGYGTFPPQGVPPEGVPPQGGGGGGTKRKAVVIAVAAAVLAAAGGVYAAVSGGDDGKKPTAASTTTPAGQKRQDPTSGPTGSGGSAGGRERGAPESDPNDVRRPGEAKVLYQTPAPELSRRSVDVPGFWVMKGYVVKAVEDKIVAYEDDGTRKWTLSLPKAVCAAPNSTTAGKVVIAYEGHGKDSCSRLALIDLDKGAKLWDHDAPEADSYGGGYSSMGMAQSGDLVGMSWMGGSAVIKVGDGKEVAVEKPSPSCSVDGYAGGKALLRTYSCSSGPAKLQRVTSSGAIKWTYVVRKGYKVDKIFSTSPAVIALSDENRTSGGILAISDSGKERSALALGKQSYQPLCEADLFGTNVAGCQGVAASSDTFYLPTEMTQKSDGSSMSEIHAFDLDSGKRKWTAKVDGRMLLPLSADGKNLIAYEEPSSEAAGLVVSIGPDGGEPKTLLRLPRATRDAENGFYSATHEYRNGNFYIASNRVTGTDSTDGTSEKLIMAFGPWS
ncbi:PQQ-binding-like beta-propeller repeat protein [Streptomyces sp. NPDC044780]|uniref:outer membrane protein assembly factor BamB family protein n=1 Tax=Streptomyces sp. NPDC044780 TaxID=3157199 RepID=UPI00340D9E19